MGRSGIGLLLLTCSLHAWGCGGARNVNPSAKWDHPLAKESVTQDVGNTEGNFVWDEEFQDAKPRTGGNLQSLDAQTRALIDAEVADLPADEQEKFRADLQGLSTTMIRRVLAHREKIRERKPTTVVDLESAGDNPGHTRLASGGDDVPLPSPDEPAVLPPVSVRTEPAGDPGLGLADPWNRGNVNRVRPVEVLPSPRDNQFGEQPTTDARQRAAYPPSQRPGIDPTNPGSLENLTTNDRFPDPEPTVPVIVPDTPGSSRLGPPTGRYRNQDARLAGEAFPPPPRVRDYSNDADPFAPKDIPELRSASGDPNQRFPGGLDLPEKPPTGDESSQAPATSNPRRAITDAELLKLISTVEAGLASVKYADLATPEEQNLYVERHVYLRMLYLMAGRSEKSLAPIPDIARADQEFWQQVFWAVSNYFDTGTMPDADYRATQTILQLRAAIRRLQGNAKLELRNVVFCHKITGFGNYRRFDRDEFGPGQPVLLYGEVGNFESELSRDGQYRTVLKSSIEIARPSGEVIDTMDFKQTEDVCRNRRSDYFHSYEFTVPQSIALGPHVLTLRVKDMLTGKTASYRLQFTVR